MTITKYLFGWLVLMGSCTMVLGTNAEVLPSPLRTLEGLVGRWVDLQSQIDSEQREWEAQRQQWEMEMELFRKEQIKLESALATLQEAGESRQERGAEWLERRDRLQSVMNELDVMLTPRERDVRGLLSVVPASLSRELWDVSDDSVVLDVDDASGYEAKADATMRLQQVLGQLRQLEEWQNGVHTSREMVAWGDGPRREMETLYVGVTAGFGVTLDRSLAVAGRFVDGQWIWEPLEGLSDRTRQLIRIVNQDEAPMLISFPLGIAMSSDVWLQLQGGQE